MRLARAVDRTENGQDAHEEVMRRLLTPIAKFWVCKRGSHFAQEAMECLGGNGYVEEQGEGVMARIYREMPLNSIWEGAGNIMALDLLRVLRAQGRGRGAAARDRAGARRAPGAGPCRRTGAGRHRRRLADEAQARRLARDIALLLQAALLQPAAPARVLGLLRIAPGRRGRCLRPAAGRHRLRRDPAARDALVALKERR